MPSKLGALAYRGTLVSLCLACLAGLAVSIWAHLVSFMGIDPREKFPRIWIVELTLMLILLPLVTAVFRRGIHGDPLRLSRLSWKLVIALTVYYSFHFYLFVARASDELTSDMTWHMFSAGWILLFTVALAFYWGLVTRLAAGERNGEPTQGEQTSAM
ncbi:MAG: hypothetical protein WBW33_01525 [Bryobacteraceae bacterium]